MKRQQKEEADPAAPVRIGIHTSIVGHLELAAERARQLGCDSFQIFSASPRQWPTATLNPVEVEAFRQRRYALNLHPLVIHDNYLINLASSQPVLRSRSIQAFGGELERARQLAADYLVMHPGSALGQSREKALRNVIESLRQAVRRHSPNGVQILLENTAGQGTALAADLKELAGLLQSLPELDLGVCIDTAHLFAAGYDLRGRSGVEETLAQIHTSIGLERVKIIHLNDCKSALGSRIDRHEHIGRGRIGREAFRSLLHHPALAGRTFILETPLERKGDDRRNLQAVRRLAGQQPPKKKRKR